MNPLKETYFSLAGKYAQENDIQKFWEEIEDSYSSPKRFYHTLAHLQNMLDALEEIKEKIGDYETVLWSLFYHDLVYDAERQDNEERSALKTLRILLYYKVPQEKVFKAQDFILSTKQHSGEDDADLHYFLDADLSILGADEKTYFDYAENVRKEYAVYPDEIYNPGRKKVLEHFLGMKRIFKTDYFFLLLEEKAKSNLQKELNSLEVK